MNKNARVKKKVISVINELEKHLSPPLRNTPRELPDPLDMLIATLLSQNTNDTNSYRAWKKLKEKFPDYDSMYRARTSTIEAAIRTGGMAKQKATRIKELLRTVRKKYGRLSLTGLKRKPSDEIFKELISLNGIGVKTASCVLLFSLNRNSFPVDTHVHRILNRLGIVITANPEKTFYQMQKLVPPGKMYSFHTNLIRFGRSVCKSRNPECNNCPLRAMCESGKEIKSGMSYRNDFKHGNHKRDFMLLDNIVP